VQGLFYRETARYADQVQRYFDVFGRERVHIILFDDLKRDTVGTYKRTLEFLNVNPDLTLQPQIVNPNKVVLSRRFQEFLVAPPQGLVSAYEALTPSGMHGKMTKFLRRLNTRYTRRPPLAADLRRRLQSEFAPDVVRLGSLIGRDLTDWYSDGKGSGE
jgi:hypothetical protein